MLVKKYGNRRLYDTEQSRYITLDELAEIIRGGEVDDVRVVSAKTGEDLTTATLAQIIVESRGAARLLPAPILIQLIRMGDRALAEFLGQYVTWALDAYLRAQKGVRAIVPFAPLLAPPRAWPRWLGFGTPPPAGGTARAPDERHPRAIGGDSTAGAPDRGPTREDVAALRREIAELKSSLAKHRR